MAGIGVGLAWLAYTVGLYGYCLFRGYNITPKQLLSTTWPPAKTTTSSTGGTGSVTV